MPFPAMFGFSGKVVLVTGSTKGIGKSIAQQMALHGAKVIVSSRKEDACIQVAEEINREWCTGEAEAVPIACNIGHRDQCEQLVARTMERFGRIDTLICNAAANPYFGSLLEIPDEAFDKIMTVNVKSSIWLTSLVVPHMAERKDGSVIIISSTGALRGSSNLGAYGLSKAADIQLVRNFTVEWSHANIRFNCIAPALVKTDFARALWEDPERREKAIASYPLGRLGDPEDISGVALALASPAGAWMTGQTIVVDGGMMAGIGR